MNRSVLPGILFVFGGVLLAAFPYVLLPVCSGGMTMASGASVPMKCFWTARAVLGTGLFITFGGVVYCFCHNPGVRLGIAAMIAGAAVLAVAFPTILIGICPTETMPCHMGTLPALILTGAVLFLAALGACRVLSRAMKENASA